MRADRDKNPNIRTQKFTVCSAIFGITRRSGHVGHDQDVYLMLNYF